MPEGPLLAIVEDVTGSGKTEAAIVLAARLMASGQADGIFFALPTMATANAMYERLSQSYRLIFHEGAAPSLVLAHGRRKLNKGFAASILENSGTCEDTIGPTNGVEAAARGDESSAACAAWIADDRRKSFLAHVGVGTIDQCFLGVLPSKHQSLRLWGLASKVLIVDEAHAYDAYMGRELERLLEFHAALGGSAIVLSATLPSTQRARLAQAFGRGLGRAESVDQDDSYPLMTTVSATGTRFNAVATREDRRRSLMVRTVPTFDDGLAHVVAMAHRGSAVAWIRNSVDDAIDAVTALRAANLAPILLHARFAMGDRLRIEDEVRITLGPDGDQSKRQGYVLVGTQILEQSLDYDVDAMVTDLAPIDLIIQRAGRLWRHADRSGRPTSECELVVIAPDWKNVENPNWYHQVSPRAAAVYRHHGLIWRGAKVLAETGAIVTPEGVRTLVASVYDHANDDMADIPDPLLRASRDAMGKGFAAGSIAEANLLEVDKGYGGTSEIWSSDVMTPTRLGDPVTVFRLGQVENGQIVPWCRADDGDIARSWALSEVSLSRSKAIGVPEPEAKAKAMILIAKQQWPEWEHDQPLLVLTLKGTTYVAEILDSNQNVRSVIYSKTIGLQIAAT